MIRLGMLDFDTSHVVEFTKRLNHVGIGEEQWVEGARVVLACPGDSRIMPERIPGYTREMDKLGVPLVDRPADLLGKVDGVLIESQEGGRHWERARPFLERGVPCFIDKPFACGVEEAVQIARLAERQKVPVFSSSALRYSPELTAFAADPKEGKVLGAVAYGPASLHPRNPGLFHYGIHAVEILYALMGPGCRRVSAVHQPGVDVVTGTWADGRVGTVRGIRAGKADYGSLIFTDKSVRTLRPDTRFIYRELLRRVVELFQTGRSPVPPRETVELVGFIEAANHSGGNHGIPVDVRGLDG